MSLQEVDRHVLPASHGCVSSRHNEASVTQLYQFVPPATLMARLKVSGTRESARRGTNTPGQHRFLMYRNNLSQ